MKPVLIVGAGPVGLMMAAELARHGIDCRIVEKLQTPSSYCRALGVTPRTMEIFEDIGIATEVMDAGLWLHGKRVDIQGMETQELYEKLDDLPYAEWCLTQNETERILTNHLQSFGITVERGITITAVVQDEKSAWITFNKNGVVATENFSYVIGCDGAHSVIRKSAGIAFEGEMFPYDFMLADVLIDWDLPRGMAYQSISQVKDSAPDFFLAIPLPEPHRYRISMLSLSHSAPGTGTDHGIQSELPAPSIDDFQATAKRLVRQPIQLNDMRWSSLFRISMRVANRYREGNIFIAGDAAHIHPPTGGQGMNTGLQDAYNLAWKMALVLQGAAGKNLLNSYDAERREEGLKVIKRTMEATMNHGKKGFESGRLVDTQVLVSYRNSDWVKNQDSVAGGSVLIAGDRAADCNGLKRSGTGFKSRLFDLLRGTGHTILISVLNNEAAMLHNLVQLKATLKNEFHHGFENTLRIIAIGNNPDAVSPAPGILYLQDTDQDFKNTYQVEENMAWLIRPDGYIAWKGLLSDGNSLCNYLHTIYTSTKNN